jgi:WD40 repeat protein
MMDRTKPLSAVAQKRGFASRLFGYDVFLSFALGPPPRGTHSYASDLARRLEQRDFTVFFSEAELAPGELLDGRLRKALLRSKTLVVISNRGTLHDPRWVRKEVEEFRRHRPGRPVIPVNIGGALQDPLLADAAQTWLDFVGRVWVDDSEDALAAGIASQGVVDRLALVSTSARANTKWRWIVRGTVAGLCALVLGLAISAKAAFDNARRAQAELRDAVASRLVIQGQQMLNGSRAGGDLRGILQVLAASRISTSQEVTAAQLDALLATRNVRKLLSIDVPVGNLSISPDGKRIASGHNDGTVRLWDAATGQPLGQPLKGHSSPVTIVAYSPIGGLLASGSQDGTVQLWDTETGKARGVALKAHNEVTGLAFSPDGRRLVSKGSSDLRMWDAETGRALYQSAERSDVLGTIGPSGPLAFSPDGRRIATGGWRIVHWDADTLQATSEPIAYGSENSLAFSLDGRSIVTSMIGYGTLRLWDSEIVTQGRVRVAFSPDGRNRISDLLSGVVRPNGAPLEGHTASVDSVAFSPDGRQIASGSRDGTVRLWDAVSGRPLGGPLEGHRARVSSVAFTPDGSVVSSSTESTISDNLSGGSLPTEPDTARIRIWMPMQGGSLSQVVKTFPNGVRTVALSPDGRLTATRTNETFRLWNVATGEPLGPPMDSGAVTTAAFSPDSRRVAASSSDYTIRIWDVGTGHPIGRLVGHDADVFTLAFSADGQRLASASVKIARNIRDSDPPRPEESQFRLWDVLTGSLVSLSRVRVWSVAFSPDNRRIVSGLNDRLRLWDASGESLSDLEHNGIVGSVAFSPDGSLIASGQDKTIQLWDSQTGKAIGAPLQGHRGLVETITFSPDGRQLVSGDADKTIRVWDTRSGQPLGPTLEGHTGSLTAVAFSRDGLSIVSAATDNTVRRWPAPKAWADVLCSKITRNLSDKEWREWVSSEIPYECQCSGLPIPADDRHVEQSKTCNVK